MCGPPAAWTPTRGPPTPRSLSSPPPPTSWLFPRPRWCPRPATCTLALLQWARPCGTARLQRRAAAPRPCPWPATFSAFASPCPCPASSPRRLPHHQAPRLQIRPRLRHHPPPPPPPPQLGRRLLLLLQRQPKKFFPLAQSPPISRLAPGMHPRMAAMLPCACGAGEAGAH